MKKYNPKEDVAYGDDPRWFEIQKMILEMAGFNFTYNLELSKKRDSLEATKIGLKILGEELYAYFKDNGLAYCAMNATYRFSDNFILDDKGRILAATNHAKFFLNFKKFGAGGPLTNLLADSSKVFWEERLQKMWETRSVIPKPLMLEFLDWAKKPIPHLCNYSTYKEIGEGQKRILLLIIPLKRIEVLKNSGNIMVLENTPDYGQRYQHGSKLNFKEIRWCKAARKHILSNITKEIPNTRDLAIIVGTNQKHLRICFKQFYGISMREFIIKNRLNLALPLVQFSEMEFKTIAENTGFKSYPHFSAAFTAKFGSSPREYRKKVRTGEIFP